MHLEGYAFIFYSLGLIGTAVFAISGALCAIKNKMDLAGVLVIAFIVGNGGGTLRSMLLGQGAVFWIDQTIYVTVAVGAGFLTAMLALFFKRMARHHHYLKRYSSLLNKILLIADAVGLGVFSVAGAQIALEAGVGAGVAIIMGIVTGVGGGILRDILCNEVPLIFKGDIYATAAFLGSITYVSLLHVFSQNVVITLSVCSVLLIRLVAIFCNLNQPVA